MREDFLPLVAKPTRYINNELNAIRKDHRMVTAKVALAFPDTYEVGMSHLGLRILYHIINERPDTLAERVFAPWVDYEEHLRKRGLPLTTLESHTPLMDFDIIGFTLPYELTYTNILNILDLADIPLRASERDKDFPLIIGGGSCVSNAEPIAEFFDAFAIGDGEEIINEILNTYIKWKEAGSTKNELLSALAEIEGIYVPSFYEVGYKDGGGVAYIRPRQGGKERIARRIITDLDRAPYPTRPVVPYMKIVHDRVTVEIARGCTKGCRFCQAGSIYRPVRERSIERIEEIVKESLRSTGYEEISLSSLSTGDYSALYPLLVRLMDRCVEKEVSVSLPSLRLGTLYSEIIKEIKRVRKTGFTIAPEAGTERLRRIINKEVSNEELDRTATNIFSEGWNSLKLYFMIGLPTERKEDIDGIIELVKRTLSIGKKIGSRPKTINLGIATFVPKPHTPFQWLGQIGLDEIKERHRYLRKRLSIGGVNYKGQKEELSLLEAAFARGDRKLAGTIEEAWRLGCRFDGWTEVFRYDRWEEAFKKTGVDPYFYANRDIPFDEVLPWGIIDSGISKEYLIKEFKRSVSEEVTEDCRLGDCTGCGVCDREMLEQRKKELERAAGPAERIAYIQSYPVNNIRIRVRFARGSSLRFLSHLELTTTLIRALRRGKIPLSFSKGFHPHPRVSFGPALPVGMESSEEYFDVEVKRKIPVEDILLELRAKLPSGLEALEARYISSEVLSLSESIRGYAYEVGFPWGLPEDAGKKVADFLCLDSFPYTRITEKGKKRIDLRGQVNVLEIKTKDSKAILYIEMEEKDNISCRPLELIGALFGLSTEELLLLNLKRVGLFAIDPWGRRSSPMDIGRGEKLKVRL